MKQYRQCLACILAGLLLLSTAACGQSAEITSEKTGPAESSAQMENYQ